MKKNRPSQPQVSIVIPCFNAERTILRCLQSLSLQKTSFLYEIIVVDSSTDTTPQLMKEYFPSVKNIRREQQTYPGAGRNIGVAEAKGEVIAFTDADCIATEDWLEQGVHALQESNAIIGGSVINNNPSFISWADYFLTFNEFLSSMPKKEVQFMPTCNFFVKRKDFQEVGGFREDLLAGEDTLFCYEAVKKYKLLFSPQVKISHTNRERLGKFLQHQKNFGVHSAYVRKIADLPGKSLVKYPFLSFAAPLIRSARISLRMLKHNHRFLFPYLFSFPLQFLGILAWSKGFFWEAMKKDFTPEELARHEQKSYKNQK